ncbi:nucleoside-diphosphate-sugar epimerase [Candidatus Methanoperedens nitroreducens]|uniref:Nucleoside-diphosphate-sugar epimerase n=1 Tax=Candidatus Methanoperedens nitratireducens TaxID=1392998 RepID=A0A062V4N3_9EURY|nr:NAD-dependent epimerase/dehydratase family protein [Candidatus Methanoperedens nitroreducens]KCZ72297.1 nucleoside-diphosphate-sugar epimerase [Candidatus Methanoperedens nitroreducens]MDJ1420761.1 NAD-dependent epimerase/dehydratase family protein [Candidatus Methanoperedens sp.]
MKSLITGCAGFIGSHLAEKLLQEGHKVIGIDCFTDYYPRSIKENNIKNILDHENFTFIEKDILNITQFPEVDYVFHQAAQAGVRASWGKTFETYTLNNILATQKLLEYYKNRNIRKFVFASSSSIYGNVNKLPIHEEAPKSPFSPYGVTKLAAEDLCSLYYMNYGTPTVSLRYFTVYGPRQRPDMGINKFAHAALDGGVIKVYGDGSQTRDFTYISDVVWANLLAAESDVVGESFNIGGGSRISVNDLIGLISGVAGKDMQVKYIEVQKGDVLDTYADVTKAKKMIGYMPWVGIEDGVKKYVESIIHQ